MKPFLSALAVTLLGACVSAPTVAHPLDVAVIDRQTGQRLPVYYHHGKRYVVGTPGHKYAIELRNQSGGRLLAVTSVDGVNVVTGETAHVGQSGYVLDARSSTEINGWRKSLDEVAAFYFTSLPDSYAARTDRPENVGVIGVAVFREYVPPRARITEPAAAAKSAETESGAADRSRAPREEKLGTGHGDRETSHVEYTDFKRATDKPAQLVTICYDSYRNLVARGVIPAKHAHELQPNPFPGNFVPDPKG
ncbi:MAG: hypothetical protein JSW09_04000 [Pseudomonadota bacterium]|nr:MAG: hypothetical protein JSW09_04000 [Pseudomonadota bacterium]